MKGSPPGPAAQQAERPARRGFGPVFWAVRRVADWQRERFRTDTPSIRHPLHAWCGTGAVLRPSGHRNSLDLPLRLYRSPTPTHRPAGATPKFSTFPHSHAPSAQSIRDDSPPRLHFGTRPVPSNLGSATLKVPQETAKPSLLPSPPTNSREHTLADPLSAALRPAKLDWRLPRPLPTGQKSGLVVSRGNPTHRLKSVRVAHRARPSLTGIAPTQRSRLQIGARSVWLQ